MEDRQASGGVHLQKTYKVLTIKGQYLNSSYDIYQGRVLICRWNFTVLDRTPYKSYRMLTLE